MQPASTLNCSEADNEDRILLATAYSGAMYGLASKPTLVTASSSWAR